VEKPALEEGDAAHPPAAEELVGETRDVAAETAPLAERQVIAVAEDETVPGVEVRRPTRRAPEVVRVGPHRGLVQGRARVEGLRVGVARQLRQAVAEALLGFEAESLIPRGQPHVLPLDPCEARDRAGPLT